MSSKEDSEQSVTLAERSVSTCDEGDKSDGEQKSISTSTTENTSDIESEIASGENYSSFSEPSSTSPRSRGQESSGESYHSSMNSRIYKWIDECEIGTTSPVSSLSELTLEAGFEVTAFTEDEDSESEANDVGNEKLSEADDPEVSASSINKQNKPVTLKQAIADSMKSIEIVTSDLGILEVENKNLKKDIDNIMKDVDKMFHSECTSISVGPDEYVDISKYEGNSLPGDIENAMPSKLKPNASSCLTPVDHSAVSSFISAQVVQNQDQMYDSAAEEKREEDPDLYHHTEAGHDFSVDAKPMKPRMSLAPIRNHLLPSPPTQFFPTGTFMFPTYLNYAQYYPGGNYPWGSNVALGGQYAAPPTAYFPLHGQFDYSRPYMDPRIRSSQYYAQPRFANQYNNSGRGNVYGQSNGFRHNNANRNYGGNQYNLRANFGGYSANYDGTRSFDRSNQQQDYSRRFNPNQGQRTGNYVNNNQAFSHEGSNQNRASSTYEARPRGSSYANQWTTNVNSTSSVAYKENIPNNSNRQDQSNRGSSDQSGSKLIARQSSQQQDWYDFEDLNTQSSGSSTTNEQRSTGHRAYGARDNGRVDHRGREGQDYGYGPRGNNTRGYDNRTGFNANSSPRYQEQQQQRVEQNQQMSSFASTSGNVPTWP